METEDRILIIEKDIWNAYDKQSNIGLYTGLSGFILFYDCLYEAYKKEEFEDKLLKIIEKTNELIQNNQNTISLSSGIAGYGLILLRLKNKSIDINDEYFEDLDASLIEEFKTLCKSNDFDYMHQAMGIAMYFIERYKKNANIEIVEILIFFSKNLIHQIDTDFKNAIVQVDDERGKYYSLGLAHGIASYLNFLIYLKKHFTELATDISETLRICIDFLISHKNFDKKTKQHFVNVISLQTNNFLPSRLSWCQGDLGIANALYNSGIYLDDRILIIEGIELINKSATINFIDSGVNDFGICHGSAGIVLQLHLASKKYGIDYMNEMDCWLNVLKEQTNNFQEYPWHNNTTNTYYTDMSLLTGAVGLGLTLLTVENKIDTEWLEILNLH